MSAPSLQTVGNEPANAPVLASPLIGLLQGKPVKWKCATCSNKISLVTKSVGLCALCNNTFCLSHRLPEDHLCTADIKALAKERSAKREASAHKRRGIHGEGDVREGGGAY